MAMTRAARIQPTAIQRPPNKIHNTFNRKERKDTGYPRAMVVRIWSSEGDKLRSVSEEKLWRYQHAAAIRRTDPLLKIETWGVWTSGGILFELGHELFTPGGNFKLGPRRATKTGRTRFAVVLLVKVKAIPH